jgi:hypothetical protein
MMTGFTVVGQERGGNGKDGRERAALMRVIKTFDSVGSLGDRFESEVFQDISTEMLYVYHKGENQWYQYRWAPGRREITLMGKSSSDLPIVIQVYP